VSIDHIVDRGHNICLGEENGKRSHRPRQPGKDCGENAGVWGAARCHAGGRRAGGGASALPVGVGVIVAGMRAHQAHAEVQIPCCGEHGALLNLAKNADNQRTIVEAGGVEVIVAGMRAHTHDARVQEQGCGALARLALNNADNRRTIAKAGGVGVIVAGLRTHAHDARVQEHGCGALWTLAKDDNNRRTIAKAGGGRSDFSGYAGARGGLAGASGSVWCAGDARQQRRHWEDEECAGAI
jgi:hypothetical protein